MEQLRNTGTTCEDEEVDKFSWREVRQAFTLPQVWMVALVFFFNGKSKSGMRENAHVNVSLWIKIGANLYGLA